MISEYLVSSITSLRKPEGNIAQWVDDEDKRHRRLDGLISMEVFSTS